MCNYFVMVYVRSTDSYIDVVEDVEPLNLALIGSLGGYLGFVPLLFGLLFKRRARMFDIRYRPVLLRT